MKPVLGIDIGGTTTRFAYATGTGSIDASISFPTPVDAVSPEDFVQRLISSMEAFIATCGENEVAALGVSVAGPVDQVHGTVENPPNIPFPAIPLARPLSASLGIPVFIANDCHCGAIGEAIAGSGIGVPSFVYLTISTGIGAGVVSEDRLLMGRSGSAAEAGHFYIDSRYNVICGCGHRGHWEGYCSGRHIPGFFTTWCQEEEVPLPLWADGTASAVFSAAHHGDGVALAFLDQLAEMNARGLSDLIVAYDPARIVLDGAVISLNHDLLLPRTVPFIDRFLPVPQIVLSPLKGAAPLLGACLMASGAADRLSPFTPFAAT